MKVLKKEAIEAIAKANEVKAVSLAKFTNKIQGMTFKEANNYLVSQDFKDDFPSLSKKAGKKAAGEIILASFEKEPKDEKPKVEKKAKKENKEEKEPKKEAKGEKPKKERAEAKSTELREAYIYPEDCTNKKAYRVKMRAKKAKFLEAIENAKDEKEKAEAEKAYAEFRKATYNE